MAQVPSVAELLANVKDLTRSDGSLQSAWSDSFIDPHHCREQGGFIYVDFPVPQRLTRAFVVRAPGGDVMNQRTQGPNAAIDLNNPGIGQNNVILAANFHTHPLSARVGGDPQPSRADMTNAWARGVPGIVVSRDGIYSYGPERRENLNNPKGYPGPVEGFPNARLERRPPPPTTVRNQWPEGTGERLASQDTAKLEGDLASSVPVGETEYGERDDSDVIYVKWSNEGVEYGQPLVESEEN